VIIMAGREGEGGVGGAHSCWGRTMRHNKVWRRIIITVAMTTTHLLRFEPQAREAAEVLLGDALVDGRPPLDAFPVVVRHGDPPVGLGLDLQAPRASSEAARQAERQAERWTQPEGLPCSIMVMMMLMMMIMMGPPPPPLT